MQNEKRPTSVTVIAWIIFVLSVLVLIVTFLSSMAPSASIGLFVVWGAWGGASRYSIRRSYAQRTQLGALAVFMGCPYFNCS